MHLCGLAVAFLRLCSDCLSAVHPKHGPKGLETGGSRDDAEREL